MSYLFPPSIPSVGIAGSSERFPVRRIYCAGWNYAEHVREMGSEPGREPPAIFTKPPDALVPEGGEIGYPPGTGELHHEVELVVALGPPTAPESASIMDLVFGYAVGFDMTRRDLQARAKKHGGPWVLAKGFDQSAPISAVHPAGEIGHPRSGRIWLDVNGERRQDGDLSQMIWQVPEILEHLSRYFELRPGDLVFTGTPAGVSAVSRGDRLEGGIEGVDTLAVQVR